MNLVPYRDTPWESFQQIHHEMNQLMNRFLGGSAEPSSHSGLAGWTPRVDIEEDEKQYLVKADLPGVDSKSVEISVTDHTLTLRGQRKEEREEKKKNYHRIERFEGEFYREIPLPSGIDADRIDARSCNGVLTISIPKKADALPKRINVKDGK